MIRAIDLVDHGEYVLISHCPILYKLGSIIYTLLVGVISLPFLIILMLVGRLTWRWGR